MVGAERRAFYLVVVIAGIGLGITYPLTSLYAMALGAGATLAGLTVATIVLGMLAVDVLGTRFVPRLDGRTALSWSLLVYGAGCLIAAVGPSLTWLLVARLFEGAGCAVFMTGGLQLVVRLSHDHDRGRSIGLFNLFWFAGLAVGPLIGGALADLRPGESGLRLAFFVCGLTNMAGAVFARLTLAAYPSGRTPKIGLPRLTGLATPRTGLALALGGFGEAIRDAVQMMIIPMVGVAALRLTGVQIGTVLAIMAVTDVLSMALSGAVTDRWGRRRPLTGLLLLGAGVALFGLGIHDLPGFVLVMSALGISLGAVWVVPQAMVVDLAADRESSLAAYRITADIGLFVGVVGAGAVVDRIDGTAVFLGVAVALLAGAALTRAVGETRNRTVLVPQPEVVA
jgi:MFS family permease